MIATRRSKAAPLDQAYALEAAGDFGGAEAGCRAVLTREPESPDALVLLGAVLQKTQRAGEAVPLIERALNAGSDAPPAWRVALAYAKRDSGDPEGALEIFEALAAEAPGDLEPRFLRAGILQRLGRHEAAVRDYEVVLQGAPGYAKALNNLGVSLRALGRMQEATEAFEKALAAEPNYTRAAVNSGRMLFEAGHAEQAAPVLTRAHNLDRENAEAALALAECLSHLNRLGEAEPLVARLHDENPDDAKILAGLGNIRMLLGRRDEAVGLARRAHALAPESPEALSLLAEADRDADHEALLGDIERRLEGEQEPGSRITLAFAAARLCETLKRHPDALRHYAAGNSARRDVLKQLGTGYDRRRAERQVDALVASFESGGFRQAGGSESDLPVFIVGMPRSGTTLTEQILASHPAIEGAGELRIIGTASHWLAEQHGYPAQLPAAPLKEVAIEYLKNVGAIGRGARRVTDKLPGNFSRLGLIARMFPKARIIHCRRDPMDNCVSCFAQNFRADGLAWSCDLEDLAHQYCQYRRIMAHWRAVLPPGMMLETDYEDTVADLESQARRIVDFTGLDWDDACLEFHKTRRAVATASRAQVRNPIYNTSVGRWKRYGDGVAPLVRALTACGCGPEGDGPQTP